LDFAVANNGTDNLEIFLQIWSFASPSANIVFIY
jgi:hypothetical protein